ncbi:MAG: Beta-barrel assembly-enhancing protease [Pseudomonadales bacterium]|nr:Beta-barrel assembly-enhancing protease [Pseudomonadales bacterium]
MNARALLLVLLMTVVPAGGWAMSEKKEIAIGREMHSEILAKIPVYEHAALGAYVTRIGSRLARDSDRPGLEYTFTVLDSPDINAFATPGGFVYLNRGLLLHLQSEAELAAVLAHEIAHITERHASRQDVMSKTSSVASLALGVLAAIGTGSGAVGSVAQDAAATAGTAMVRGYGRDMELEADREGAKFMQRSGYDPLAMVEVLGALKEQESFARVRARAEGRQPSVYHGVFSTHPRNDQRLQEVVAAAAKLPPGAAPAIDVDEFRRVTDGMKFGERRGAAAVVDGRYYNGKMGFTVAFPTGWQVVNRATTVLAEDPVGEARLQMTVRRSLPEMSPAEFAAGMLGLRGGSDAREIAHDDVKAFTARYADPAGGTSRRVGVVYHGPYAYVFEGRSTNAALAPVHDVLFVSAIGSFRALRPADRDAVLALQLRWVRAEQGVSFAQLAAASPVGAYAEEQLRLLNGAYPHGEPRPGEWIRIVQ